MAWTYPEGIRKDINISKLSITDLEFYHDNLHIFWERLLEGYPLRWSFKDIYTKHREVVLEMLKRKIKHLQPINNLDNIRLSFSEEEVEFVLKSTQKRKK